MPRGPRGEWRPRDPFACAAHVMGVLTGRTPETYEPPADHEKPKPPDPAAGGRARAAKMSPEERSASARRAVGARWQKGAVVAITLGLLAPATVTGQDQATLKKTQEMTTEEKLAELHEISYLLQDLGELRLAQISPDGDSPGAPFLEIRPVEVAAGQVSNRGNTGVQIFQQIQRAADVARSLRIVGIRIESFTVSVGFASLTLALEDP